MRAVGALLAWPFHLRPWWGWQRAWAEFWQCVEVKAAFVPQVIWISSVLPSKSLPSMMTPTGVHQKEKGAKKQTCLKVWMSTFVPCDVVFCSLHLGWPIYQGVYIYLGQLCRGQQHRRLLSARGCDAAKGPLIDSAWASLADVPFEVVQDLCFVTRPALDMPAILSFSGSSRMHRWQTLVESGMEPSKFFHGCNHSEPLLCC